MVDDDPEDRAIIEEAMEQLDAKGKLHFAENGEQALMVLNNRLQTAGIPSLVVLDLNMPKLNGTETLRAMKSNERLKHIPVVIYSTSINPLEKEKCLLLGAQDYFTKPISLQESRDIAEKLLRLCDLTDTV